MSPDSRVIKGHLARMAALRELPRAERVPHPPDTTSPEDASDDGAQGDAEHALMTRVRKEAARTLVDARRRRDRLHAQAREDGMRIGYHEGLQRAEEMLEDIRAWWDEMRAKEDEYAQVLEAEIADLVGEIVGRVLRDELATRKEVVLQLVSESLRQFTEVSDVTLAVSREQLPEVLEFRDLFEEQLPPRTHLLMTSRPELSRGEFHIRGDEGIIVGSVDDIVAALRRRIEDGERGES